MPQPFAPLRDRLRAIRMLQPLAERDYALLTFGSVVSLLGDGFFTVALAWTLPLIVFLPLGGAAEIDAGPTMIGAGLLGSVLMGALLFVPGVREPERRPPVVREGVGE
jgi:hypothetical protein